MISIEERLEIIKEMEREEELLSQINIEETLRMEWEQKEEAARRRKNTERRRHTVIIEGFPFYDKHIDVLEPILQP